jgi:hypothetical protein
MFDVDELNILSGYVGPQPIMRLAELPIHSNVIYGMYGAEGIRERLHNSLQRLNRTIPNMEIYYSTLPAHSKCYIWKKKNRIVTALIGSANFSVSGLSNPYREVLAETTHDSFNALKQYYDIIFNQSLPCSGMKLDFAEYPERRRPAVAEPQEFVINDYTIRASLLMSTGEVSPKAGLNWGLSDAHVTPGDAYIAIKKDYIREAPDIFQPKQSSRFMELNSGRERRQNDAVEFIWDDGTIMEGLLEGNQDIGGITYPKQMCSSPKKNILGIYIRERLGLPLDHLITRTDLEAYGRTDITISLQGEGIYGLDFSTEKQT